MIIFFHLFSFILNKYKENKNKPVHFVDFHLYLLILLLPLKYLAKFHQK